MASISSLGIGSDLLSNQLLEDIVNAERAAGDLRLKSDQELIDAKISAYGEIQSQLYAFSSTIVELADDDKVGATLATSSDETILTATATVSAPVGSYAVEVQRTAKSHSLVSKAYTSVTDAVGIGTLTFRLGTTSYTGPNYDSFTANPDLSTATVTINSGNNTLQGLRDAINAADFGVTASLVNNGSGYVLQLVSEDTGEATSMEITTSGDATLESFAYNSTLNLAGTNMTETQKGEDALLSVNGLAVTRSSNEVTELIDGVTLNLKSANVGQTVTIDVAADIASLGEKINAMVEAYNNFRESYEDLTSFDPSDNTGSVLLGDSTLRSINNQIRSIMTSTVSGVTGTTFASLSEMGIYTDQNDSFKLQFNQSLFTKALNENREAVVNVFAEGGRTTDLNIEFLNSSLNSKAGTYDINISQIATQGSYTGGSIDALDFAVPVIIDDANDAFTLSLNGVSDSITLTQGSYATGAALATELQQQINSATKFKERGYSASVTYDSLNERFQISSNLYGSKSAVSFSSVDTNTANSLGFTTSNQGVYQSASLATLNSAYFAGYGTSTIPGNVKVDESTGLDFSLNNASFDLKINGGAAVSVTVNQKAAGSDLNSDGIYGDRKDTLQAIQNAIDATALAGTVVASFDSNDYLIFTTQTPSSTDSIEISAVGASATDLALGLVATQGAQINGKDPGLTLGSNATFNVVLNGTTSANTVTLPAGTYATGAALATALQTAINTDLTGDANLSSQISGATTNEGTRDIATNIDFATTNAGFTLKVNGTEQTIIMDADSGNNITDIQAKLDAAFGAGVVTAQLGASNGLELVTVAQDHNQSIQVTSDGRGARTDTTGTTAVAGGIDFSGANNATFDLVINGGLTTLNVDVNTDTSSGDKNDVLTAVQTALDTALVNSGSFSAGDVVAKYDGSDRIYFETVSDDGVKTAGMYGSAATIRIENVSANADTAFGLTAVDNTTYTNGYDSFGIDDAINYGSDITAAVEYAYDAVTDTGSLLFDIGGNGNSISFDTISANAISFLGLNTGTGTSGQAKAGVDVKGTINGVEAKGNGQYLTAQNGNVAATNGYYIANETSIFLTASAVTISAANNNNTFDVKVDGTETTITVADGTYNTSEDLATAIQTAFNSNTDLTTKNLKVKVEYTSDATSVAYGKISIISASTGATSKVEITDITTQAAAAYGFVKGQGDGEAGKNKQGEIDDASGIRIKVSGGSTGDRGTVTYISGIADQLKDLLQDYLNPNGGLLATKFETLDKQNDQLAEEKESFEKRISAVEAQLAAQFAYNDAIIATLNTTASYLTQQFEAMAAANKK